MEPAQANTYKNKNYYDCFIFWLQLQWILLHFRKIMPREREDVLMNRTIMQYTKIENTRRKKPFEEKRWHDCDYNDCK